MTDDRPRSRVAEMSPRPGTPFNLFVAAPRALGTAAAAVAAAAGQRLVARGLWVGEGCAVAEKGRGASESLGFVGMIVIMIREILINNNSEEVIAFDRDGNDNDEIYARNVMIIIQIMMALVTIMIMMILIVIVVVALVKVAAAVIINKQMK